MSAQILSIAAGTTGGFVLVLVHEDGRRAITNLVVTGDVYMEGDWIIAFRQRAAFLSACRPKQLADHIAMLGDDPEVHRAVRHVLDRLGIRHIAFKAMKRYGKAVFSAPEDVTECLAWLQAP